jgi:hypothetical protein
MERESTKTADGFLEPMGSRFAANPSYPL